MVDIDYILKQGEHCTKKHKFDGDQSHTNKSFQTALDFAIKYSKKHNCDVALFLNSEGTFIDRELVYCGKDLDIRFVVLNRFCHTMKKRRK